MGLWLNESYVLAPERLEAAAKDLAERGFGIIRVMLRNTSFNHRSPLVVAAVARLVKAAHEHGVRVVLDCEPHSTPVGHDMAATYPGSLGYRLVRAEATLIKGRFVMQIPDPHAMGDRADFRKVEIAFLEDAQGIRKLENLAYNYRSVCEPYANGFITRDHTYTEGRPGNPMGRVTHITGTLPVASEGKLIIYAHFFDSRRIDFWSDDFRRYFDDLLECYRDVPLDGIGWDEPATEGSWNHYIYGEGYKTAFRRMKGYDLTEKLYLLDDGSFSPEAVQVRLDYYHVLNEALFDAQARLFAKSRELFGEDIILGTHHTWHGEGNITDYRCGAVDYFRLNENMDVGYTDCWWWDPDAVNYAYTLGSSLGRLTPGKDAEINTWDAKPTNSRTEYNARLMTLMNVLWFNIWYGDSSDTCLYPADYTWETAISETHRHQKAQQLLGSAVPVIEVAMLHGWETVCGVNRADVASAHKAFTLNQATLFIERSVPFDWVDTSLIAKATITGDRLVTALGSYRVLVLPFATVLPRAAWEKTLAFAKAGGKVVFTGTPPHIDTEGGSLAGEFSGLLDMPALPLEEYLAGIDAVCTLPNNRPQKLEITYPLAPADGREIISIEGEVHGIRSPDGNVVYITDLEPAGRLLDLIQPWLSPVATVYSETILWRPFRDDSRDLLVLIARQDRELNGLVRFAGKEFEFKGGKAAILEARNGEVAIHGDAKIS